MKTPYALSWNHPNLHLKESPIQGVGLHATKNISTDVILSVFGGKIYTSTEIENLPNDSFVRSTASQVNNDFYIGPVNEKSEDISLFINHSCEPNAKIDHSVLLISIKPIKQGDEITIDYAHSHNKLLEFECNCGGKNCRKNIKNNDYRNKKFKEKNLKHYAYWMK